jgi:DNA-binding CsgD family transcriptional regulator
MEVLVNSPNACLLVDRAFRPVFVNQAAREILDGNCGVLLRDRALLASRHEDTRRLRHLIERACSSSPSGGEMAIFRERGQPLLILVSPVQRHYEAPLPPQTVAAVWLSDPNRSVISRGQRIRSLFGLTRAEASIAVELAQGLSLYEIADTLVISRHTARNHLKHIFEKMGAHRQTDVVRLVLSCPDAFGS